MSIGKPTLLLAGGGYADIPLILAAMKLGYRVVTSGNRLNDLGHRHSDAYEPADFSSPVEMLAVAKRLHVQAVCACCNDFSALSCAYVAQELGLPGHDAFETSRTIHHKDLYRAFAIENGIATPRAVSSSKVDEALGLIRTLQFPLIVKPVDLTGGKGISTFNNESEAPQAISRALEISRAKRVVVEEFITGSRHGFSAFVLNGKVVFYFWDNEHYYQNPFLVAAASTPGKVPESALQKLIQTSEKIVGLLSLKTGIFHVQFILHDEEPIIIEICRRAPGDLYIHLVKLATGVDYPEWIVRAAAGLPCDGIQQTPPKGFFSRHCIMARQAGRVRSLEFDDEIREQIIDQMIWGAPGDEMPDPLVSKFGIVFLKYASERQMLDQSERMQNLIRIKMDV